MVADRRKRCRCCGNVASESYLDIACSPQCFSDLIDAYCERYRWGMMSYAASGKYGKRKAKLELENTTEPTSPNDED